MIYELPATITKDILIKAVDSKLIRGCTTHKIEPLTMINSTQRIVHTIMKEHNFSPSSNDQQVFEELAEFSSGSPVILDIISRALRGCYLKESCLRLSHVGSLLALNTTSDTMSSSSVHTQVMPEYKELDRFSDVLISLKNFVLQDLSARYDSYDSILKLLNLCDLSEEEVLLLRCLSVFGYGPIPFSLVTEISSIIAESVQHHHIASMLHANLMKYKFVERYPASVVYHPFLTISHTPDDLDCVCVPHFLSDCLLNTMEEVDVMFALSIALYALQNQSQPVLGINSLLLEAINSNFKSQFGKECYKSAFGLYLSKYMS